MLPGKKYTPDDIAVILKKRFWWIVVPFAVVAAGTAVVAHWLPDVYSSTVLIGVVQQQVPQQYVKAAVTTRLEDRLPAIEQTVLNRTKLENIIEEFNLYPEERKTAIMQDIVDRMRQKDIHVDTQKGDVFTVTYLGSQARLTQKVADRLGSLFIQESLSDRASITDNTTQFLDTALKAARDKLQAQEAKLAEYKTKYAGQLPDQVEANLQALNGVQQQINSTVDSINRAATQKLIIVRQLADLQNQMSAPKTSPLLTADASGQNTPTAQKLASAKEHLAKLQADGYSDAWPDVKAAKSNIDDLTKALQLEQESVPVTERVDASLTPAEKARKKTFDDLTVEKDLLEKQISGGEEQERNLRGVAAGYQDRLNQVPNRETELTELMRDYGTLTNTYNTLDARREEAALSANLERGQIGERFAMIDQAQVPDKPISPNRPVLNIVGMVAGLGIGLVLVGFMEYRDSTFKTDVEVAQLLSVPVLAVVPVMLSDNERRAMFRRRFAVWMILGTGVMSCMAVVVYTFVKAR